MCHEPSGLQFMSQLVPGYICLWVMGIRVSRYIWGCLYCMLCVAYFPALSSLSSVCNLIPDFSMSVLGIYVFPSFFFPFPFPPLFFSLFFLSFSFSPLLSFFLFYFIFYSVSHIFVPFLLAAYGGFLGLFFRVMEVFSGILNVFFFYYCLFLSCTHFFKIAWCRFVSPGF